MTNKYYSIIETQPLKTFDEKFKEISENWEKVDDAKTVIRNPVALESAGFWNATVWLYQSLKRIMGVNNPDLIKAFKGLDIEGMEKWEMTEGKPLAENPDTDKSSDTLAPIKTVQDLIDSLSKIDDKSRPVSIGIQDALWTGQYESLDENISVKDNWSDDVVIHVDNPQFSFLKKEDAKNLQNIKNNTSKLVKELDVVKDISVNLNNSVRKM